MKPIFILLLSLSTMLAHSTPCNEKVAPEVLASFQKTFATAEGISWTESTEYYKASFQLNNQYVAAYFSKDGNIIGLSRNISFTQLPVLLQTNLNSLTEHNWIAELFELSNDEGTSYYITLENANEKITLRSVKNEWQPFQKKPKP